MSRTLKDRPYWVLKNDPNMDRYPVHDHLVPQREEVGEEEYNIYGWRPDLEPVMRKRTLYKRWYVHVPCTLDMPETNPTKGSPWQGSSSNEEMLARKNCEYYLVYYPNIKSHKDVKRAINQETRSKARRRCKQIVRDYMSGVDSYDWDVYANHRRAGDSWWWD